MAKSIQELQEEIESLKKSINEKRYEIARYEDDLDRDSYYRRDYQKEAKINEYCDILSNEVDELNDRLKKLESWVSLKLRRNVLQEQKERLEVQYKELEGSDNSLASTTLMEIYALKQDIEYIDACIKRNEREEIKKNKK